MTTTFDSTFAVLRQARAELEEGRSPYSIMRRLPPEPSERPLIVGDPVGLRSLLEWCAITDPRLFHAMFLHHCMTIGNALDQGADDADIAVLAGGARIGAALMNEAGRGNSAAAIRTTAAYDPASGEFVLHTPDPGAAKYPPNVAATGVARLGVVSARLSVGGTDRGLALFLVELRDEQGVCAGVTIEPRPATALLPMDYATVRFDGVRVPYRRWLADGASIAGDGSFHDPLGDPGARTRRSVGMSRFSSGAVAAGLAAVARAGTVLVLERAKRRITNDRLAGEVPALAHRNQQRLLFGAAASALAATVVAHHMTGPSWHIPPGGGRGSGPAPEVFRELGVGKVAVDRLADAALTACRSAAGMAGFFSEHRLLGYQALTMAFQSAGGDNRLILLEAAWSMATAGAGVLGEDLAGGDRWTRLFRAREQRLYTELTADLPAAVDFEIWNERTDLAQRFAAAHAARTTVELLYEAWHAPDVAEAHRLILDQLYRLHCLTELAADAGWFLAHELLTATEVLALPEQAGAICGGLAAHVDTVVELLDVPIQLLDAPMEPVE